ncbi:MAG: DNA topoisomerase (ATP-hydrolyzing) subunit A [Spirochaetia bacterium]|nr:DNA topoisomerase (ATP-hydrolyzing) subunit A [Spirochaetia bacterium]MBQ3713393.1 DNA topoisomerase (ATP-hydrolyzing) subunit A [Spirochaetia bacterium]
MDEILTPEGGTVIQIPIEEEVKQAYIDYSMSVIVQRALPDVRDGLKPVHRRILYAMDELHLVNSGPTRKCAKIVGDVLGKYHPHGDASVYDALVRLGQDFAQRYTVITPQGNFGTIAGDPAAAYRYTEAKMAKLAEEMVKDIDKETVDMVPNFDETVKEPTVLPAKFPFLLCNGTTGIAVGMATNMPPHNLREVAGAISAYIDNPDITVDELCNYIKGPDFPTGGIVYGTEGFKQAYRTGRGKVVIRAKEVDEVASNGKISLVFTEVPYGVNTTNIIKKIKELVKDKVLEGISDANDESSDRTGMRLVVGLKRDASPKVVLNQLYARTDLQANFGVINLALVDGRPQILTLKELIQNFVKHRDIVVTRRTQYELKKAQERAHILEALIVAVDNIDEVVAIIRASADVADAKAALCKRFGFDDIQAQAIVDMQLKRLTHLQIDELKKEMEEILSLIRHLEDLLAHHEKILAVVKSETNDIADRYGDDRRTEIVYSELEGFNIEDLIEREDMAVLLSNQGFIKRVPVSAYKSQSRGGKGSLASKIRPGSGDFVEQLFIASTHDYIFFVTNRGRAFWLKVHEIPENVSKGSRGVLARTLFNIDADEEIETVINLQDFNDETFILFGTAKGIVKKVATSAFRNAKTKGIRAIEIREDDRLISAILTHGNDDILVVSKSGNALRYNESAIRAMGRGAMGVIGMRVQGDDQVAGIMRAEEGKMMLLITTQGYGKRVDYQLFKPHGRSTKGQIAYGINEKTGQVAGVLSVAEGDELMCITSKGNTVKVGVNEISTQGRSSMGVKVVRVAEGDYVISLASVTPDEDDGEGAEE